MLISGAMRSSVALFVLSISFGATLVAHAQELDAGVDPDAGVPQVDLSTPRATMKTFLRAKKLFMDTYGTPPGKRGPVVMSDSALTPGFARAWPFALTLSMGT